MCWGHMKNIQWTGFLPLWSLLSNGGADTVSKNCKSKYLIANHNKCYEKVIWLYGSKCQEDPTQPGESKQVSLRT